MKLAIMQPYLFPYIGYFQLINAVDKFVVYDNIEFTQKGWFHRNRILVNNKDKLFTIPLKRDSDFLKVNQRYLAQNFIKERTKILSRIRHSYTKAPHFADCYPLIEDCFLFSNDNLFHFILNSLKKVCDYVNINTDLVTSSTLNINHLLKGKDKVIAICKAFNANHYINSIGGVNLYNKEDFLRNKITLQFMKSKSPYYEQFSNDNDFVPNLSVIDVMMFNSKRQINEMLKEYEI